MNDRINQYMAYHPVRTQRGLEILTGFIPWMIILFPLIGSFFIPEIVAYFILAFNVYWLYRSLQMTFNATLGYLNLKATQKVDWFKKLRSDAKTKARYQKIVHLVIIPNVREPLATLERNIKSLIAQNLPSKKIVVVLAMEERAKETDWEKPKYLVRKYGRYFRKTVVTWHPLALGETIGKHSNEAFAARAGKKLLVDEENIPMKNIVMTTTDADGVFTPQYFSLLTYKFLVAPKRFNNFFQAPLFMHNNIDRVPLMVRITSIVGGVFFLSLMQKYSKRFINFSTYSLSLKLLDRVGYWDIDVIPEDSRLYFKSYFALSGEVSVVPLYVPVNIDAPESTSRWKTYQNSYRQNKRWAWGVVDVPYVVKGFFAHPEIPFFDKIVKISLAIEWHFVWSSYWFLLVLGGTAPTFINPAFARTSLGFNLSRITSGILTISLIGLLTIIFIDILIYPHKKNRLWVLLHPFTYLQWLTLPVVGLIFGSLPGLESQTRLMLGKYLEYRVTEKV